MSTSSAISPETVRHSQQVAPKNLNRNRPRPRNNGGFCFKVWRDMARVRLCVKLFGGFKFSGFVCASSYWWILVFRACRFVELLGDFTVVGAAACRGAAAAAAAAAAATADAATGAAACRAAAAAAAGAGAHIS